MERVLVGAGGHAREVAAQMNMPDIKMFVEDMYLEDGLYPLSELDVKKYEVMIAIGDPVIRKSVENELPWNIKYFTFVHETAIISHPHSVTIGKGSFIGAGCIITRDVEIGMHSILNRGVQVGHDCDIGNYVSLMPSVIISGNVVIGNCVFIGTNSSVKEKVEIGNYNIIGMQSCVIDNIFGDSGTYVGCPAKKIK